jgi:hypothetical protein
MRATDGGVVLSSTAFDYTIFDYPNFPFKSGVDLSQTQ